MDYAFLWFMEFALQAIIKLKIHEWSTDDGAQLGASTYPKEQTDGSNSS